MLYIYCEWVHPENKGYIGRTSNPKRRDAEHRSCRGQNPDFDQAIRRHGESNVEFIILATTDTVSDARKIERWFIKTFNTFQNGYNRSPGESSLPNNGYIPKNQVLNYHELKIHAEKERIRRGIPKDPQADLASIIDDIMSSF